MGGWNRLDLTGQTFGRLTAVAPAETDSKFTKWLCRCECGNTTVVFMTSLRSGQTQSCGCLRREQARVKLAKARKRRSANRYSNTPTFESWASMRWRCLNPTADQYRWYGGRGITIDPRWDSYANFLADMGERPPGTTLDRIDGDGPYTATNCRWADHLTQANNRRGNRRITYDGRTQTMSQWAREYGLRRGTLFARLDAGWDIGRAFSTPIRGGQR